MPPGLGDRGPNSRARRNGPDFSRIRLPLLALALGGLILLLLGAQPARAAVQKLDCSQPLLGEISADTELTGTAAAGKTCTVVGILVVRGAKLTPTLLFSRLLLTYMLGQWLTGGRRRPL